MLCFHISWRFLDAFKKGKKIYKKIKKAKNILLGENRCPKYIVVLSTRNVIILKTPLLSCRFWWWRYALGKLNLVRCEVFLQLWFSAWEVKMSGLKRRQSFLERLSEGNSAIKRRLSRKGSFLESKPIKTLAKLTRR